jgi:hypothetical protein
MSKLSWEGHGLFIPQRCDATSHLRRRFGFALGGALLDKERPVGIAKKQCLTKERHGTQPYSSLDAGVRKKLAYRITKASFLAFGVRRFAHAL